MQRPNGGQRLATSAEHNDAFLYGAGSVKIGTIIFEMILEIKKNNMPYDNLMRQFFKTVKAPGERKLASCGKMLKERFMERIPGLKKLIEAVEGAAKRGYLVGLDGRHLAVRSSHAALNTLLQSAGALVCKRWMVEVEQELQRRGWKNKVRQMGWIHDEMQFECDPDIAEEFGHVAVECIAKAGQFFNIRLPLTGEAKQGSNWKECH